MDAYGFLVPGRIEVLGKHTDYAGGRSMVAATEKGFCLVAAPRRDAQLNIRAAATGEKHQFEIHPDLQPKMGHWSNYPMTVARRVARNFGGELRGADMAFCSDLPAAAGMSSSSAMMVGIYMVLAGVNQLDGRDEYRRNITDEESLAGYLGAIENGQDFGGMAGDKGVGTFGGSEDHTAILCARSGRLSQYRYCPVRFEKYIKVPKGYVFGLASSGVAAEKTGSALEKYNRVSRLASAVTAAWNRATGRDDGHMAAALASGPVAIKQMRNILKGSTAGGFGAEELTRRFEHFCVESEEIIPAAGAALERGDIEAFGGEVDRSQELAEALLGNQVSETIFLARTARELGAASASAFGAGFGGSVWALGAEDEIETILRNWEKRYKQAYPNRAHKARFFISRAGPAAFELK
ncbi:MAG: hypothetical protein AMJ79_00130 [Phycisphaerae bacterium SM23_30]|nr:MAG: hypothetical protein AMJ79_00130 [Phycisphaerae bacterium SM23_30]